ncbi:hypothetical protein Dimus_032477 [Dionaea muscipula]
MELASSNITAACHQSPPPVAPSEMEGRTANLSGDLFFPEEVVVEILARLPVRSLLRFKCVCKTWFSLIGSEYFAGKHLFARSMVFKHYNFENLLVDYHHSPMCRQFSAVDFNTLSVVHRKFKIVSSYPEYFSTSLTYRFVGSCNGIVCLLVQDTVRFTLQQSLLLWNPATDEVKTLQHENRIDNLGFGFDPKMNDYKVVLFSYLVIPKTEHVSVYSSLSDSWKNLDLPQGPEFYRFLMTSGTTNSGGRMLNWLGHNRRCRLTDQIMVISFDLSEEAFVMTPMPPRTKCKCGRKHKKYRLIRNTPDQPCTIVCFPNPVIIDDERECFDNEKIIHIWTLNEYGESGSWTKLRSLVMLDNYVCLDLYLFWKGGEEVLFEIKQRHKHQPQLASYNPITQQLRLLRLKGQPLIGYTESLVSINGRYGGGGLLLDDPNMSVHDVEDIDNSREKPNYYSLVDDSTGRIISRFHMTKHESI